MWKPVEYPEDAHYTHFCSERNLDFDISKETLVRNIKIKKKIRLTESQELVSLLENGNIFS